MNSFILIFIGLLIAKLAAELCLEFLNAQEVKKHREQLPDAYNGIVDADTYRRTVAYTLAKNSFGRFELICDAIILAVVVISGILPWLFYSLTGILGNGIWAQAAVMLIIMLLLSVPSLPFELWKTF